MTLPRNPQYSKVQTPVLHPMPVPQGGARMQPRYVQASPVYTTTTGYTSATIAPTPIVMTTPQAPAMTVVQPQPVTQPVTQYIEPELLPLPEPVAVVTMPTAQPNVVAISTPITQPQATQQDTTQTKVDFSWIEPAPGTVYSQLNATLPLPVLSSTQVNVEPMAQPSSSLVLLDVDDSEKQAAVAEPVINDLPVASVTNDNIKVIQEKDVTTTRSDNIGSTASEPLVLLDTASDDQDQNSSLTQASDETMPVSVNDVAALGVVNLSAQSAEASAVVVEKALPTATDSEAVMLPQTQIRPSEPEVQATDEIDRTLAVLLATSAPVSQQVLILTDQDAVEATAKPSPEPVVKPDNYQIQKGDTLWSIAMHFYGNGHRWVDIARANGIRKADKLNVGQTLKLPD
jgi:LysM repeat protein